MSDIVAFLRARLDEDEQLAQLMARSSLAATRPLREVEAKRFVVETLRGYEPSDEWDSEPDIGRRANNAAGALRRLAAVYSDHPDYDPEWRLQAASTS